jgi:hypothetical protein
MEVKVGIQNVAREVTVDTRGTADEVEQALREALGRENGVLILTDEKGRRVLIPAGTIAYVDLGSEYARAVGFGAPPA